jgi:hypothetical protein
VSTIQKLNEAWDPVFIENAVQKAEKFISKLPTEPPPSKGRGIIICGGGVKYFTSAWICIRMLRHLGCELPIQLWHLGRHEVDARMREVIQPYGVECVDALELRKQMPVRRLNGYELKAYSLLHSPFREVLLLDADNVPLTDPCFLFETPEFRETGALFWPDYGRLAPTRAIWKLCGVPFRDEPEFESGQIVVDKHRCWKALALSMWYNEHSDFFYRFIHGDKDTFHMAFRKLEIPYAMPAKPIESLEGVMCQHDFQGNRIFQHRNSHKWSLSDPNKRIEGFIHEDLCLSFLDELKAQWNGLIAANSGSPSP